MSTPSSAGPACPLPLGEYPWVVLAHGGGGRLMAQLIERVFLPAFANAQLDRRHDGAVVRLASTRVAFTTDSYVVQPLFFPGGDIGSLAVYGTVNDLAMCGARPQYLSCGMILEEGLELQVVERIAASMQRAARRAGVQLVTGDTKVVERGKGDGLFVNTAGIGVVESQIDIGPDQVRPGDVVLLSGDIGRHGVAILAARESLEFEATVCSDCAPLAEPVMALLAAGVEVHCLRDLTRGGLASAAVEIAARAGVGIELCEREIPVLEAVRASCEILGLDPLYVANEGRFVAIVPQVQAEQALQVLRAHAETAQAVAIGRTTAAAAGQVAMESAVGGHRLVDRLSGEQLPRIC